MCHRMKIVNSSNFRLNPQTTHPYNADFDGDEMVRKSARARSVPAPRHCLISWRRFAEHARYAAT